MHMKIAAVCGSLAVGLAVTLPAYANNEAPELAASVADGSLPALEERLPTDPFVIEPLDSVGDYGGTWRFGDARGADEAYLNFVAYEGITRLTPDGSVVPNIVEESRPVPMRRPTR